MNNPKIALITGVNGQDGSYLAEWLLSQGYLVHGLKRRASSFNTERIDHLYQDPHTADPRLRLHYGDMTDATTLLALIQSIKPHEIYNLAAQSHVAVSFEMPEYTANADGLGTLRLLEAIRSAGLVDHTRFYQASTSEMFGGGEGALNEDSPFQPRSPYGAAKLYAHWITSNYRDAYGMYACSGILFNHESPRRGETFVSRKITRGLCRIKAGLESCLYLGNLDAIRDWGHAKDYVRAQWLMLQQATPKDYVIASGVAHTVRDFVVEAANLLGFELEWHGQGISEIAVDRVSGAVVVRVDPRYFRPLEVHALQGDATRARSELGWVPEVDFRSLVAEMVQADRRATERELKV